MISLEYPFNRLPPCASKAVSDLESAWERERSRHGGGKLILYAAEDHYRRVGILLRWSDERPAEYEAYYQTSPGEGLSRLLDQLEAMKEPPLASETIAALRALRNVVW